MNKRSRLQLIKALSEEIDDEDLSHLKTLVQRVHKKVPLKIKADLAQKIETEEGLYDLVDYLDENYTEDFNSIKKSISNGSFNWEND